MHEVPWWTSDGCYEVVQDEFPINSDDIDVIADARDDRHILVIVVRVVANDCEISHLFISLFHSPVVLSSSCSQNELTLPWPSETMSGRYNPPGIDECT
jgi:hypothetical protein